MKKLIFFSLVLIIGFHFVTGIKHWYDFIWWLDDLMHLLGGAWVALLFFYLFSKTHPPLDLSYRFPAFILALGFVALIGVLWEFYEYLADVYILKVHPLTYAPNPNTLPDTMADLVIDLIGGTATSVVILSLAGKKFIPKNPSIEMVDK